MRGAGPKIQSLRQHAEKLRTVRKVRTPYYMVDLPQACVKELELYRDNFIETMGRDYEDMDPQFWDETLLTSGDPKPIPGIDDFIREMADAMAKTNHHPAHVYAVRRTQRVVHIGNFKDVPDAWTQEWQMATQAYEKWKL